MPAPSISTLRPLILLCAFFLLFSQPSPASDTDPSSSYVKTELYFGPVDLHSWTNFLAKEVTPRFPQGLSWMDVHGQWRDSSGSVRKLNSRLLIIIYPPSASASKKIEEIRSDFKAQFHQKSVLSVTEHVNASF